jgi:uncharacterized protein (TIGR00255 family)
MTVTSMTGFARSDGTSGASHWSWELKTVNAKGLDVRLRLPPGFDALEPPARSAVSAAFARGSCQLGLTVRRDAGSATVRVNQAVLDSVLAAMNAVKERIEAAPPRLDGLFAIRGVLEVDEAEDSEEERAALHRSLLAGLEQAIAACGEMRRREGAALSPVLRQRLDEMEALTRAAEANPARAAEAVRERLASQIAALTDAAPALDPDRLHQEAILLATKADIQEELDRLAAHVAAARELLGQGGAIGRRLDFLAQELGREANTLCSKSNDVRLTATGLSLKAVIEQFREQVQNIE